MILFFPLPVLVFLGVYFGNLGRHWHCPALKGIKKSIHRCLGRGRAAARPRETPPRRSNLPFLGLQRGSSLQEKPVLWQTWRLGCLPGGGRGDRPHDVSEARVSHKPRPNGTALIPCRRHSLKSSMVTWNIGPWKTIFRFSLQTGGAMHFHVNDIGVLFHPQQMLEEQVSHSLSVSRKSDLRADQMCFGTHMSCPFRKRGVALCCWPLGQFFVLFHSPEFTSSGAKQIRLC